MAFNQKFANIFLFATFPQELWKSVECKWRQTFPPPPPPETKFSLFMEKLFRVSSFCSHNYVENFTKMMALMVWSKFFCLKVSLLFHLPSTRFLITAVTCKYPPKINVNHPKKSQDLKWQKICFSVNFLGRENFLCRSLENLPTLKLRLCTRKLRDLLILCRCCSFRHMSLCLCSPCIIPMALHQ